MLEFIATTSERESVARLPRGLKAYRVRGLMEPERAAAIVAYVSQHKSFFDVGPDSVDLRPTFEKSISGEALDIVGPAVGRAVSYARRRFGPLELSRTLIRSYRPGERRQHPAHFDADSRATVVIALNEGFEGGYYAQPECFAQSRRFVELAPGDAFAHEFDLRHGVDVRSGTRFSLVLWFAGGAAVRDTPDAAYLEASKIADRGVARRAYERAARLGSADAALNVGAMSREDGDEVAGLEWFREAAFKGKATAMRYVGTAVRDSNPRRAIRWLTAAARSGDAPAMRLLWASVGDESWLRRAASKGHPDACVDLAELCFLRKDPDSGVFALRTAAANGAELKATFLLGNLCAGLFGLEHLDLPRAADCFAACARAFPEADAWLSRRAGNPRHFLVVTSNDNQVQYLNLQP